MKTTKERKPVELTPAEAVRLADRAAVRPRNTALDYVPAMLTFVAKGYSPDDAAAELIQAGCKESTVDLVNTLLNYMQRR